MQDESPSVSAEVGVLPWWSRAARAVWEGREAIGMLAVVLAGAVAHAGPLASLTVALTYFALVRGARAADRAEPERAAMEASAAGLKLAGRFVPRARLRRAFVTARAGRYDLELTRRGLPSVRLVSPDRALVRRVVDVLGLGLDRDTQSFTVASRLVARRAALASAALFSLLFLAIATAPLTHGASLLAWAVVALVLAVLGSWSGRLVVARDAIRWAWLGSERSFALRDVVRVEALRGGKGLPHRIRLTFRAGPPQEIPIAGQGPNDPTALEQLSRVAECIETALAIRVPSGSLAFRAWNEEQASQPPRARLEALRAVRGDYRGAAFPFSTGELFGVLDDPHALPVDRIAAAIALTARGTDRDRERVAGVSKTTALPALTRALRALRERDDAALEGALRTRPAVRVPEATEDEDSEEDEEDELEEDAAVTSDRRGRP